MADRKDAAAGAPSGLGDGSGRSPPSSSSSEPPRPINVDDPPSEAQLALRRAQIAKEEEEATRPYHARVQAPPLKGLAKPRELVLDVVCTWPNCVVGSIAEGSRFKRCGGCLAPYCSRNCQEGDWKRHRPECKATIAARKERDFARAVVPFASRPAEPEPAPELAPQPAPSESPAAAAERTRVEALPTRALKAELAARGVSVLGLSERREFVAALLSPLLTVPVASAATASAPAPAPLPPTPAATPSLPASAPKPASKPAPAPGSGPCAVAAAIASATFGALPMLDAAGYPCEAPLLVHSIAGVGAPDAADASFAPPPRKPKAGAPPPPPVVFRLLGEDDLLRPLARRWFAARSSRSILLPLPAMSSTL